jgi:predicted nucleotidyltransferase
MNCAIGARLMGGGMSKFDSFDQYPARGLGLAESILLTVWPTLNRHQEDMVLIGGLAVHYLTREHTTGWPGAVTMDVDLGLSLAVDDDRYGNIMDDMRGLGFGHDPKIHNRLVKEVDGLKMYLDFLTDAGTKTTGTALVSDLITSSVPGLERALCERRWIEIEGCDVYGVNQRMMIPVCDVGPLLVLKLNAFGGPHGRRHPKDAYDVLLCVTGYPDGPKRAIEAFQNERNRHNPAYPSAVTALRNDFKDTASDGPMRAANFLRAFPEQSQRLKEELVTAAEFMLAET